MIDVKHTAGFFAVLVAGCATAPQGPTLGEFLDQGAVRQSQPQVRALLSSRTLETLSPTGQAKVSLKFDPAGTFTGTVRAVSTGAVSRSSGTWSVEPDGRWCMDETLHDWNMKNKYCHYVFLLPQRIVGSESLTDRTAKAFVRDITDLK